MLTGKYTLDKEINFSLQGLDFLNSCLCFEEDARMNWNQVKGHNYLHTESTNYIAIDRIDCVSSQRSTNRTEDINPQEQDLLESPSSLPSTASFHTAVSRTQKLTTKQENDTATCEASVDADTFLLVAEKPKEGNLSVVSHDGRTLVLDIYGVDRFAKKCRKAFHRFCQKDLDYI